MLLFIVFENPDEVKRDIAVMLIPPANFPILTPFTMLVHASTGFHAVDRFSILVLTIHWKEDFQEQQGKVALSALTEALIGLYNCIVQTFINIEVMSAV
jgi:hypothetical protein